MASIVPSIDVALAAVADAETTRKVETAAQLVGEGGAGDAVGAAATVTKVKSCASVDNEAADWPGRTPPIAALADCN